MIENGGSEKVAAQLWIDQRQELMIEFSAWVQLLYRDETEVSIRNQWITLQHHFRDKEYK